MSDKIVTVQWLNELAPSADTRDIAAAQFERQTGAAPTRFVTIGDLGIWGWASEHAIMLFSAGLPKESPE